MTRKKLISLTLCAVLICLMLAGCTQKVKDDVSGAVSRVKDDVSAAVSRTGSALESFFDDGSSALSSGFSSDHNSLASGESGLDSDGSLTSSEESLLDRSTLSSR